MVLLKYSKNYESIYLPHLDTLRAIVRTLKRTNIDVKHSQGFNPHPLVFFAPPLPIGLASMCEYVAVTTDCNAQNLKEEYNKVCVKGLKAQDAFDVGINPNIASIAQAADIMVKSSNISKNFQQIKQYIDAAEVRITYERKGICITEEVKNKIHDCFLLDENTLMLRLGCGNNNLRADRLLGHIARVYGFDLSDAKYTRTSILVQDGDKLIDFDTTISKY